MHLFIYVSKQRLNLSAFILLKANTTQKTIATVLHNMSGTDIFSDISLLFWLCRVYGFTSFQVTKSEFGRKRLRHRRYHYFIFSIFQIIVGVLGFWNVYRFWKSESTVNLPVIIRTSQYFINAVFFIVFCFCSKLHDNRYKKFWQSIYNAERGLKSSILH